MRYMKVLLGINLFLLSERVIFSVFDCHCLRNCCLFGFLLKQRTGKQKKNDDSVELTTQLDDQKGTVAPPNSRENTPRSNNPSTKPVDLPTVWPNGVGGLLKEEDLSPKPVSRTDSWNSNRLEISGGGFRHVESTDVVIVSPKAPPHNIAPGSGSWDGINDEEF